MFDKPLSVKELLANPALYALCVSGFALSALNSGFQVTFALFAYTSVLNGGLGLSVCGKVDPKYYLLTHACTDRADRILAYDVGRDLLATSTGDHAISRSDI